MTNGSVHFTRNPYCVFDNDGFVGLLDGGSLKMNQIKIKETILKSLINLWKYLQKKNDGLIQTDGHGQKEKVASGVFVM